MVVLSASICTRGGKALVSRQFVEMTRMRVEGLLAAFPKLVEPGNSGQQQHTYVETDTVRYLYQPLENAMYLLIITTKASNIVEDLSTLRLLAKVVPDVVAGSGVLESSINENAFEIIFAFDEVLTAGGYRDEVTLSTIKSNLEMDSHEEKMQNMIDEQKRKAAAEESRKKAAEFQHQKFEAARQNLLNQPSSGGMGSGIGMQGFGGGGGMGSDSFGGFGSNDPYGGGGSSQSIPYGNSGYGGVSTPAPAPVEPKKKVVGMKLGGLGVASKKDSLIDAFAAEDKLRISSAKTGLGGKGDTLGEVAAPPPSTPASLTMEEKINVVLRRDGEVESCEVKGILTYTANTEVGRPVVLSVVRPPPGSGWNCSPHPKINRNVFEQTGTTLGLKSGTFPLGRSLGVFRWNRNSPSLAPLSLNVWPEEDGDGTITVNMEYTYDPSGHGAVTATLMNVDVQFSLGTTDPPLIEAIDGSYHHDPHSGTLVWRHASIGPDNPNGSLEFRITGSDPEVFFPVQISFTCGSSSGSGELLCPLSFQGLANAETGASVPFAIQTRAVADKYECP